MELAINENEIIIAPNPSNGDFNILQSKSSGDGKIEIFNAVGRIVYLKEIVNSDITAVNLENVSSGIYFVKVNFRENSYNRKILIQRE